MTPIPSYSLINAFPDFNIIIRPSSTVVPSKHQVTRLFIVFRFSSVMLMMVDGQVNDCGILTCNLSNTRCQSPYRRCEHEHVSLVLRKNEPQLFAIKSNHDFIADENSYRHFLEFYTSYSRVPDGKYEIFFVIQFQDCRKYLHEQP